MTRAKYNAWELKQNGELPEDVNASITGILERFQFPPLLEVIARARQGLLHGRLFLLDAAGVEVAALTIRRGVVYDADLQRTMAGEHDYRVRRPFKLLWKQHLRNDSVSWSRNNK